MASRVDSLILFNSVPDDAPAPLVNRLAAALTDGQSVLVTGEASPSLLLAAAARHPALAQTRVLRVGPPLDLIAMLRQVTADDGPADSTLEEGFDALTVPSPGCGRIALFVEGAHLLPHATLRYIEFALRAGPYLQVVLAGQSGIADMLALDGFAGLRSRVALQLELPDPGPGNAAPPAADLLLEEPGPAASYRMTPPRLLACAAAAAGLAIAGMISLVPHPPQVAAASAESGTVPLPASVGPLPDPVSIQAASMRLAQPAPEPEVSAAVQPGPGAEPAPSLLPGSSDADPTLAANAPVAPTTVAANAPEPAPASVAEAADTPTSLSGAGPALAADAAFMPVPPTAAAVNVPDLPSAPAPTAEAADTPASPASEAGPALATDAGAPVAPLAAANLPSPSSPTALEVESASEVAETAPLAEPLQAPEPTVAPAIQSQAEAPAPGLFLAPAAAPPPAGGPAPGLDLAPSVAPILTPAAHLTVPMPAAGQARAAVPPPAAPRAPTHSVAVRPERVAERSAPVLDGQRCRSIILRLQLGETPTDGDRTYLRNGCR